MGEDVNSETKEYSEGLKHTKRLLDPVLPEGENFSLIHVRSPAQKCRKLVFTSKSDTRLDTVTTHYFVLLHGNLAVVSLELYTYESQDTFTIFISKADTTGHYYGSGRLNVMAVMQALMRSVCRHYSPINKKARICLFAKAEGQYLFLGSIKNPRKHVLSDAQLVKWWVKCLDGMHDEFTNIAPGKCTLAIPGISDARGIASYFPPCPRLSWSPGDIFWETEVQKDDDLVMAVKRIPRFPDDPKSRFLDSIVAGKRAKSVSRKQFWLELESRQEFLLGKSVGVIGLETWFNKDLAQPCFKEPASSKRDCTRFKDLLIDLNFETIESTKLATEKLLNSIPENSHIELTGSAKQNSDAESRKRKANEVTIQPVNTLGGGLIRKKKKT